MNIVVTCNFIAKMSNNFVAEEYYCKRKIIFNCVLNNEFLIIYVCVLFYSTEYSLYVLFSCFNHVPHFLLYIENCAFIPYICAIYTNVYMYIYDMLARIRFILFAIYYLPRFAWRMFCVDVSRVTILFEVLRFLTLYMYICYFRNTREWNSRHLHRDDVSSTWLQIVQVSSTTNQVLQTARLSRNPDVCVHVLGPYSLDVPRPFAFFNG